MQMGTFFPSQCFRGCVLKNQTSHKIVMLCSTPFRIWLVYNPFYSSMDNVVHRDLWRANDLLCGAEGQDLSLLILNEYIMGL